MGLLNEFKQFAMRGNVVDMAVGVIIGAAFGKIVTSLVTDVVMPLLGLAIGGINFTEWKIILKAGSLAGVTPVVPPVTLNVGNFIQITFDFLIIAFVIFMALRTMNTLIQKEKDKEVAPPAPVISKEEELLAEIRDLLKSQK